MNFGNERASMAPVALVTGVGRPNGIGAAICRALAERGVYIAYSWWRHYDDETYGANYGTFHGAFGSELESLGGGARGFEANLADPETPPRLIDAVVAHFGPISILVNNAAVSEKGSLEDLDSAMIDRHLAVNVRGMALLTKAFVQQFRGPSGGRVIMLTSGQSLGPMPDELAYATSKGAVETFVTSAAPSLARRGITINAVNPGPTDTGWMPDELQQQLLGQFPLGRLGQPEDAARLVAFLASTDAEWITGQIIHSEGGFWRQ
jgi:3-oxoacyl-[acyl-carrier protein] reductase